MSARDVIALQTLRAIAGGSDLVLDDFDTQSIAQAYEDADAILSALAAAGYAVVPREPTRHMMECAVLRHHNRGSLAEIWTAMLAAAKEREG